MAAVDLDPSSVSSRRWVSLWPSLTPLPPSCTEALHCKRNGKVRPSETYQRLSSSWQTSQNRQGQHQGQCLQTINHVSSAHTNVWERVCITKLTSHPAGFFFISSEQKETVASCQKPGNCTKVSNEIKPQQWPIQTVSGALCTLSTSTFPHPKELPAKKHRMLLLPSGWH